MPKYTPQRPQREASYEGIHHGYDAASVRQLDVYGNVCEYNNNDQTTIYIFPYILYTLSWEGQYGGPMPISFLCCIPCLVAVILEYYHVIVWVVWTGSDQDQLDIDIDTID